MYTLLSVALMKPQTTLPSMTKMSSVPPGWECSGATPPGTITIRAAEMPSPFRPGNVVTTAEPKNREVEAEKARERSRARFGQPGG